MKSGGFSYTNGTGAPIRRDIWERWSLFMLHEGSARKQPSANQDEGPPKNSTTLAPWSQTSSLHNLEKCFLFKPPSLWCLLYQPSLIKTVGKWWVTLRYLTSYLWKKGLTYSVWTKEIRNKFKTIFILLCNRGCKRRNWLSQRVLSSPSLEAECTQV